jgi:hypothetical protein
MGQKTVSAVYWVTVVYLSITQLHDYLGFSFLLSFQVDVPGTWQMRVNPS